MKKRIENTDRLGYCKKLLSIMLAFVMLFSITSAIPITAEAATQNALWFMDDLKITQVPGGDFSHKGTQNFDVEGVKNNNIKAPFDCKIVKIHSGELYGNAVIIESTSKVLYADGTTDYMSMCFAHDNDISDLSVGKTLKQGQVFYQTGTYGNATARHSHITVIKGKYKNDMWTKNSYDNYCSPNAINPTKGLFITDKTNVVDTKGLSFKKVKDTCTIAYNGNGGTVSESSLSVSKGSTMGSKIPTATRNGYLFDGWYSAASGGTRYTNSTSINSNTTLYAHWSKINDYSGGLKSGRIYRIVNKKSGMALQASGTGDGSLVKQQPINDSNSQLWKVGFAGGVVFSSVNGGRVFDIKSGSMANEAQLQLYGLDDASKHNRIFIPVSRGSGYYSIHALHSNRVLDVAGASTNAGTQIQQYYYTGNAQQLFSFQEYSRRTVTFYDNLSNNYLPTPREVYNYSGSSTPKECYITRNSEYITTSINASQNKLIINSKKAGSSGKDLSFKTTVNGSYNYDMYDANTQTMYLGFTAKSSVQGAKMYFRWGYDSDYKSITLNTTETNYLIELPRTKNSNNYIHPYIDRACTIEMRNIQLKDSRNGSVDLSTGDTFTAQTKAYDVNDQWYGDYFHDLPNPKASKDGYSFDGWYTSRVGGTRITEFEKIGYNTNLYAHWIKKSTHTHNYNTTIKTNPTCTKKGYTTYKCSCGDSYVSNYINAIGHNYDNGKVTKKATCNATGVKTYTCAVCKEAKTETIAKTAHTYKTTTTKATTKKNGSVVKKCSICGASTKATIYYPKTVTLSTTNYTYNGKAKKPSVTVKDSKGKKIATSNYTVTYQSGRKNVGKYTVTIKFKGNYSGTVKKTFTIKPKSTTLSSVTAKSKGFTAKWKKLTTQTTGYQIQYSTSSKFSSAKTVTVSKNSTTSKTVSKLTAKKKYYVRIRTYKTVGKTKIYSAWSKSKSVTTKK